MSTIQTVIDVVVVGGAVGVLFVIMAVVVNRVESTSPPKRESFDESDKMLRMGDIAGYDVVFCRTNDICREMKDDTVQLSTGLGRVHDQITIVDCDVDQPVYCDAEDISRISSYLDA